MNKPPLPVPPSARKIHERIGGLLAALSDGPPLSCLDKRFRSAWTEIATLIDRYQQEITAASLLSISCSGGCASCCFHWVEDVNSFEAETIAEYLTINFPEKIPGIAEKCRYNEKRLISLNKIVEAKLASQKTAGGRDTAIDPVDLLLASFYRLCLPCPLLEENACIAYPVRPLTCRMYVSFSSPSRCSPEANDTGDVPTYLFDLDDTADAIIDKLHFKFMKFEHDSGLQSLLIKYLSE
jgi:Fe-S-cluster containining protein